MMTKTDKKNWLAALRSGEYKQGQGALRTDDRFCCLGLLCEINPKKAKFIDNINSLPFYKDKNDKNIDGFFKNNPFGINKVLAKKLANMNDTGMNFKEIASYISRNVKTK